MAAKSELKTTPVILKNRRPSKGRSLDSSRVKPLNMNYVQVRQAVKVFSSADRILKDFDLESVLVKFPVRNS